MAAKIGPWVNYFQKKYSVRVRLGKIGVLIGYSSVIKIPTLPIFSFKFARYSFYSMLEQFRIQLKQLIAEGQLIPAFERLRSSVIGHAECNNRILTCLCTYESAKKQLIGGILSDKAYRALEIQTANALLAVVDELAETDLMPLATNAWIDELKGLAFGQIGKLHLVNCDRDEPFSSFSSFFQKHGSEPCQFYFIAGHTAQKPSSFAERIIYEIVEAQQLQEDNSVVEYEREEVIMGDTKIGRVKFQPLPLGLNTESSQLKFKKYFSERMGQYGLASNLDTFFESKEKQLKYNYFALVFQLESERLNADVSRYLQWIMERFRQTQDGQPRFLIFFVIHIPQANLLQSSDPYQRFGLS